MASEEKIIYVYDDFSEEEPVLLGKLYVGKVKGGETYSFEYDKDWLLRHGLSINLDPEIQPFTGRQFSSGKNIFGLFADASPDRWERLAKEYGLSRGQIEYMRPAFTESYK